MLSPISTHCPPLHSSAISFFCQMVANNFATIFQFAEIQQNLRKNFRDCRAVQRSALCRSRRELSNAYFLEKFRFDTAENEPCQVCRTPTAPRLPSTCGRWRRRSACRRPRRTADLAPAAVTLALFSRTGQ